MAGSSEANQRFQMTELPLRTVLKQTTQQLESAGIDTPRNDARLMLAEACHANLHELDKALLLRQTLGEFATRNIAANDNSGQKQELQQRSVTAFEGYVERRIRREPLQYIVGHAPFRFLELKVGPGVFIPRPETEVVVQAGLDWLAGEQLKKPLVVDLCAGSGAIGLAVATEIPGAQVYAVELSQEAAVWTRRNYEQCKTRIEAQNSSYHLVLADATAPETLAELDGKVDLLISNPPYIPESQVPTQPEVVEWDPPQALYGSSSDGTALPRRIAYRASTLLRSGGCFVMEHDPSQSETLQKYVTGLGFVSCRVNVDLSDKERYIRAIAS